MLWKGLAATIGSFLAVFFCQAAEAASSCAGSEAMAASCVEELEEMEAGELGTELLQVQLELQPHRPAVGQAQRSATVQDEEIAENSTTRVFYGKVKTDSPHWCAHIPWMVQFVVPPCWFGKPRNETLGPDGTPDWCKWVAEEAKHYTPECSFGSQRYSADPLGTSSASGQAMPRQAPPAVAAPAAAAPAEAMPRQAPPAVAAPAAAAPAEVPKKKGMPAWCKEIPKDALKFTPECNSKVQSLWLEQQKANETANNSMERCSGSGHLSKGMVCYGGAFLTEVFFVKAHHGRVSMWTKGPKKMKCLNRRFQQAGQGISIQGVSSCFSDVEYNIQYCSAQDQVKVNLIKPMKVSVVLNRKHC